MYSQHGEDEVIQPFLPDHPNFSILDIGAHDGALLSNSKLLLDTRRHARAVLVEPCPLSFVSLLKRYSYRENIVLINAAIVPEPPPTPLIKFYWSHGQQLSTLNPDHKAWWDNHLKDSMHPMLPMMISPLTTQQLVSQYPGPFDLVSIDTEGTNHQVFASFPDHYFDRTQVLIVEHEEKIDALSHIASRHGFKVLDSNPVNTLFVRA